MSAYMIVQIKVLKRDQGLIEYRNAFGPLAKRFGGRNLVKGDAKLDVLEGTHDGRGLVVFEFPALDAIHRLWNDPAYAAIKSLRDGLAEMDIWAVSGSE